MWWSACYDQLIDVVVQGFHYDFARSFYDTVNAYARPGTRDWLSVAENLCRHLFFLFLLPPPPLHPTPFPPVLFLLFMVLLLITAVIVDLLLLLLLLVFFFHQTYKCII